MRRFATHLNPVVLDALQTVLTQFPEDELDYIVERLTGLLLPDRLLSALDDGGAHTVVVSADPGIPSVPWEALGAGGRRLGLDFALCRTPSLLRNAALLGGASCAPTRPRATFSSPTVHSPSRNWPRPPHARTRYMSSGRANPPSRGRTQRTGTPSVSAPRSC